MGHGGPSVGNQIPIHAKVLSEYGTEPDGLPSRNNARRASAFPRYQEGSLADLVVVRGWHAPVLHMAARTSPPVLAVEQASFALAALLVWLTALGSQEGRRSEAALAGALKLFFTPMHMTLMGGSSGSRRARSMPTGLGTDRGWFPSPTSRSAGRSIWQEA